MWKILSCSLFRSFCLLRSYLVIFFSFLVSCDKQHITINIRHCHLNILQTQDNATNNTSVRKLKYWGKKECGVRLSGQLTDCHKNTIEKDTKVRKMWSWVSDASSPPLLKLGNFRHWSFQTAHPNPSHSLLFPSSHPSIPVLPCLCPLWLTSCFCAHLS